MELLGVGPLELVFILLIALIVIGPRDISKSARAAGRFLNRMYKSDTWRTVLQASRNLRSLPNRLAREAELEELREARRDLESAARDVSQETRELETGLKAWTTPPAPAAPPAKPPVSAEKSESPGD